MAVALTSEVKQLIKAGANQFVEEVVSYEKSVAPVDSGRLAGSIHAFPTGEFSWRVTTSSSGDNGFAYPARIEMGEGVVATRAKALHFVSHGQEIYTKAVGASSKSGFAKKTISRFG